MGFFYLIRLYLRRRQVTTRAGRPLEVEAEASDETIHGLRERLTERELDELPAENEHGELSDPRGPRADCQKHVRIK